MSTNRFELNIEKLPWDSSFFSLSIGKLILPHESILHEDTLKKCAVDFDLVYLFSSGLKNFGKLQKCIRLVDTKVTFIKDIKENIPRDKLVLFDPAIHFYNSLLELAYVSGAHSRFKCDKKFPPGSFENLYKRWIDKSIESDMEWVIVKTSGDQLSGFVSVEVSNQGIAKIGLIAVHQNFQSQSIGSKLLKQAESYASELGARVIEVATQDTNLAAVNFYLKNGYVIKEKIYIYHYWVK